MIGILILQFFGIVGGTSNGAFISLLYLTIMCLIVIIYMILSGVELNSTFALHKDILLNMIGHLMKENSYSDSKINQIASIKLLKHTVKKLDQDEVLRPVKIMGFRTDSILLAKILTVFFSGLLAIVKMIFE